ncbi:Calreticulin family protein [Tritrichomonas foetus]|uniref:Calreticulin family protein n=1 Tax=Tritrichomonas foetus TaxID=1144522 RepID=A0A1J4KRT6_9EUKA|nr:Calreticulin family protein [Tritrichomonas foetus]|eukprot:OHT13979.1 Calreticulin family protein [Tritrichomonas foetus]
MFTITFFMILINLLFYYSSQPPKVPNRPDCEVYFYEAFSDHSVEKYWIPTDSKNYTGAWQIEHTEIPQTLPNENALVAKSRNSHSAISTKFKKPITFINQTFVLQYEMRPQFAFTCSGAYLKLFSDSNFDPKKLTNETKHILMFGPDRCGELNRIHFIFNYFHPKRKIYKELILKSPPEAPVDVYNHLYTLIVRPNNTFSILVDNEIVKNGSLFFDFDPPLLEPREIPDPDDKKPEDWNENKSEWKQKKILNPFYFMDVHPHNFPPFSGIGFEIWHVNRDLAFQNILIAGDEEAVLEWNKNNFLPRQKWQLESYQEEDEASKYHENSKNDKKVKVKGVKENLEIVSNSFKQLFEEFKYQMISLLVGLLILLFFMALCCRKITQKDQKMKES